MNGHLTERQLIDYEFDLVSEAEANETRAHLEQCGACRAKRDELKRKFASLDLLRDEVNASEALISKAVENAARAKPARVIAVRQWPWLGTAAAAVIVGFMFLFVSHPGSDRQPVQFASDQRPFPDHAPAAGDLGYGTAKRLASGPRTPRTVRSRLMKPPAEPVAMVASDPHAAEIAEKPPFAPASAIELVVLPRRQDVQLTIYNAADLTLVREKRNLTLKRGWNWLQFMWANTLIDPTSLSLEPMEHKDQVDIQQLVFPPRLRELGRWLIRSEVSGQVPFELTYFTSGLSWRAFYMGTLSQDEKTMHLDGYVRVANDSGENYEDARTRLIVGKVHLLDEIRALAQRQYAYGSPVPHGMGTRGGRAAGVAGKDRRTDTYEYGEEDGATRFGRMVDSLERKEIVKEGLSEYFLYTIKGTETIPNQWGKRLLSSETKEIPVSSLYKYDEQRWGTEAVRFVSFANDAEHNLGDTPIPDGTVRIYGQVDPQAHLSYVGASDIKYIPVGEEIELNLGPARLVKVESTLMDTRTENYVYDSNDNIIGWDMLRTLKNEVSNARTLPVEIEITRGFGTAHWELESIEKTVAYEKHDVTHARFKLTVPPRSKQVFNYTDRTYYGVREEVLVQKQQEETR